MQTFGIFLLLLLFSCLAHLSAATANIPNITLGDRPLAESDMTALLRLLSTQDVPELSRLEERSAFATTEGWATFMVGELGAAGYTLAYIAKDCRLWSEWNDQNIDNWSCAIKALSTLIILSASTYATSGVIAAQFLDDQGNHSKRWLNTTENMENVYNISMLINTWNSQGINATLRKPPKYIFADEDHNIYTSDIVFSVDEPRGHNILWYSRPDGGTILLGKPAGSSNATLVKKGDWNDQYFIHGGLAMDYCKLNGNSELLNIIYDFDKAYDALNSNPGFWYYEKGCWSFRVKDNNHNAWISMGAIKPYYYNDIYSEPMPFDAITLCPCIQPESPGC
ncbi:hypothetical protein V1523DRAFT_419708 [Lipomyces doorenjongii]